MDMLLLTIEKIDMTQEKDGSLSMCKFIEVNHLEFENDQKTLQLLLVVFE